MDKTIQMELFKLAVSKTKTELTVEEAAAWENEVIHNFSSILSLWNEIDEDIRKKEREEAGKGSPRML